MSGISLPSCLYQIITKWDEMPSEMRKRLGLTQAEVAERMNVRQERVSAIERAKVDTSELRTLAAYIQALGGRMEIIADFGGERLVIG
jgi:transcriptional regulator with XRE-family HTH domain